MKVKLYFAAVGSLKDMQMFFPERKEFLLFIDDNGKEFYALFGDDLEAYNAVGRYFATIAWPTKKAWMEIKNKCKIVTV